MLPILIVDDEPSIAQLIAMTLEPLGQPLIIAHDGERAADLLETLEHHKDGCVGLAATMISVNRRIIAFADELAQIDTAGVPETVYAAPLQNVLREDKARPGMDREALLANAPQRREGYLLVPQVVE